MTEEQTALARRAVACKGWRWMPGMLAHAPDSEVEARVQKVDGEVLEVCLPDWYGVTWLAHRVVPDLTDPATLGCLLALVREAWGKPAVPMFWGDYWQVVYTSEVEDGCAGHQHMGDGDTEVQALVAALEVAP